MPTLLAFNVAPSPTFLNQALAIGLWGVFVSLSGLSGASARAASCGIRLSAPVLAALAILCAAALWSWGAGGLPSSLALSGVGLFAVTAVLVVAGAAAGQADATGRVFYFFCVAWAVAGTLNAAIGIVQVFAPSWPDGDWIAHSTIAGRAVGNLRQPNHLSSLLLWSVIAIVALVELRKLRRLAGFLLAGTMIFAVVLTASRTGVVGVLMLALWGALDRRLAPSTRALLLAAPLAYAASWLAMSAWADASAAAFGGRQRLSEGDLSGSRFGIWADTLALIRAQPWSGVGFGEFNFAWSLTPFPGRPVAFFDHTHNLPLQLAVELGIPLATLVMGLLAWGLWTAWRRAVSPVGARSVEARTALVLLLLIGLHSLLEYPLWYSYFLLPAAWAWGYALGPRADAGSAALQPEAGGPSRALVVAGLAVLLGAVASVADYARVAVIFSSADTSLPLAQRIAHGQRSVLFSHHAHYAAATVTDEPAREMASFDVATHYLLDTRLMLAWARAYADSGATERARHIAQRLREFRNPQSEAFFAECDDAGMVLEAPFQCEAPRRELGWREFLPQ